MRVAQGRMFYYLISCVLVLGMAVPAFSQESASDTANQQLELETLTVTAEKREEKIQEVAMSVSAYSETTLEDTGVDEIRDVAMMVPNLDLMNYSGWGYRANFRGMNYCAFTNKLPFVMYIDNVPYDDGTTLFGEFNNIERIEVLRGANGTLYGQNALAGVINIVSKVPGNEPEGKATVKLGQYETYGVNAYYNGPLVEDKLFFGFSGSYDETAGFLKNDYPGEDTYGGGKTTRAKGRLRWKASDRLTADLSISAYQYLNKGGIGNLVAGTEWSDHEYRDPDDINEMDSNQISLDITYEANAFDIESITTHRSSDKDWISHCQYLSSYYGRMSDISETEVVTQEFRIRPKESIGGLKWLAGLYFMNEEKDRLESGTETYYNAYAAYGINANYNYYNWPVEQESNSRSIFGQVTIPLADKFEITVGARYETIEKTLDYTYEVLDTYGSSGSSFEGPEVVPTTTYSITSEWSAFLPRAVLSYKINPEDMVFFSYSKGYVPGGFNIGESDKSKADFDAQYSTSYELGTKTARMNNRLTFNAAVFYTAITDMHVYEWPTPNVYVASNAGEARSQGAEIELTVTPATGLEFSAALGIVDCEFIEYEGHEGKKLKDTPEYTAHFSGKYRHGSGIYLGGSIQGVGDAWADDENTVKKEAYWIANTRIGYEKRNWDIYLNIENLADTKYLENIFVSNSMTYSTVGKPRTIGIIASTRF